MIVHNTSSCLKNIWDIKIMLMASNYSLLLEIVDILSSIILVYIQVNWILKIMFAFIKIILFLIIIVVKVNYKSCTVTFAT